MSYTAPNRLLMPSRHSIDTITDSWAHAESGSWTPTAWPSANLAIYVPLRVPKAILVRKLWFASGSTGTGNVDMALYDAAGVAVVTATNAAKVASATEQVFDVTDTPIGPGLYYIGLASDSGTDTFACLAVGAPVYAAMGLRSEASAYPLPSTATWSVPQTLTFFPAMGLLIETTVA